MNQRSLSVAHYMTSGPYAATPKEPLVHARQVMEAHAIRHLPVEAEGKLVGIVSDRDLELVWSLAHAPPDVLTVEDAMTPDPYTVRPETPLDEAASTMADRKIGSAVVVDHGHVVGVLTSTDAMRALADVLGERHATAVPAFRGTAGRVRRRIAESARLPEPLAVDEAVDAVMGALAERLTSGEAHALLDALPSALCPMFEKHVLRREGRPVAKLDRAAFVDRVARRLGVTPALAEIVCGAVFESIRLELPEKMIADVARQLPRGLVELWIGPRPLPPAAAQLSSSEIRRSIEEEIDAAAPLPAGVTGEDAFAAVMCALADRLSRGEAREVLLGLPEASRPLVARCMLHRGEPPTVFGREQLADRVAEHLHVDAERAEIAIVAVFRAVKRALPAKAIRDVASQLPSDLVELWGRS